MSSSGKRKSGGAKGGTLAKKKKKQQPKKQQSLMASVFANSNSNSNSNWFHKSMLKKYLGTRVLLSAMAVYNRNVLGFRSQFINHCTRLIRASLFNWGYLSCTVGVVIGVIDVAT